MIKWFNKTKEYSEIIGGEAEKFANKNRIDIKYVKPDTIKEWILRVQYYIKN